MADEELSLRDSLESAIDAHEAPATGDTPATPAPDGGEPATPATGGQARDPSGRFARKAEGEPLRQEAAAPDTQGGAPVDKTNGATPKVTQQADHTADANRPDPYARAPQSWKPGAREAWGSLPPDVREEIHRRERETTRAAQEHAQARNIATYVQRLSQQFAPALQAEGVDVMTASANLMNLASRLRYGSPVEKAQLAAQIVRSYGVDVVALAAALDGQQYQQQQGPAPGMYQDPRVDQLLAQLNQSQQQATQREQQKAVQSVEAFGADPKNEFFEDVREEMGDLMEVAGKRGIDMSLEQAYERACAMHPEIAKVLAAREAAKNAGNATPSIRRAKAAASSVRGTPSTVSTPPPPDLRGAIEAAIEQVGGR